MGPEHAIDELTCEYRNSVTGHPTIAFLDFIAAGGLMFEEVAAVRQAEVADHNGREIRGMPQASSAMRSPADHGNRQPFVRRR